MFDVLRNARLLVAPRRAYHKTTDSHYRFRRHPNLLKSGERQVHATASEQVWVVDITYLPTNDKIVGWHVHDSRRTEPVAQVLMMALCTRQSEQELVHHSDRGIQYCSSYYQAIHQRHGMRCSMTDGYDCYQNALAERVNGIIKGELLLQRSADLEQARRMVRESVQIYNTEWPHLTLKMQAHDAVHRASLAGSLWLESPSTVSP